MKHVQIEHICNEQTLSINAFPHLGWQKDYKSILDYLKLPALSGPATYHWLKGIAVGISSWLSGFLQFFLQWLGPSALLGSSGLPLGWVRLLRVKCFDFGGLCTRQSTTSFFVPLLLQTLGPRFESSHL